MDIKIKDSLHILVNKQEYIVRPGTVGVERNRTVFFFDTTRTHAVGFSREHCLENPQNFQVSKTLNDKEVQLKDVLKVIDESGLAPTDVVALYERLNSL